jgi:mannose-6-phosphate isomerase-like protein (cupin superfamily)
MTRCGRSTRCARKECLPDHHTEIVHYWPAVLQALLVPSLPGRNNRVMHLIGRAGTYTPPDGGESNHWIVHMNSDALSLGTYSIPAGGTDDQEPHTEDEVYVVQAGRATLVTASGTVPVEPGSVVFVPAGETHKFTDITENLALVVIFAPRYGSRTPR